MGNSECTSDDELPAGMVTKDEITWALPPIDRLMFDDDTQPSQRG
jgi:hypothetical protein